MFRYKQVVARCAEHLDEFLRRNIPLRLLIAEQALRILPIHLESYCKDQFKAIVHIMNINCPFSTGKTSQQFSFHFLKPNLERIIQIGGEAEAKGWTVGHILELIGNSNVDQPETTVSPSRPLSIHIIICF